MMLSGGKRGDYQNCSMLHVLPTEVVHSHEQFYSSLDWIWSHWAHFTVPTFICVYFCVFYVHFFHTAYVLYYVNTMEWTWWNWSLILRRTLLSFIALTLLVGLLYP